jgi:hypothetical protein
MLDERYAPPKVEVRDVPHEDTLARRPAQVRIALALIALSWLLDLPAAWALYREGTDTGFLLILEGVALLVLLLICRALARGHGWVRHLYALLTVAMIALSFTDGDQAPLPGYATAASLLSTLCAVLPLGLLYLGPAARWYRALHE